MNSNNAASPDHTATDQTRKDKANEATTSHRHPSLARASDETTSATIDVEAGASSPIYASATTTVVIIRHHRQEMPLSTQPTTRSMTTSIQSNATTKVLWRFISTQILHALWSYSSFIGQQQNEPCQIVHHITRRCNNKLVCKLATEIDHVMASSQGEIPC
jgi:hypothetical protein